MLQGDMFLKDVTFRRGLFIEDAEENSMEMLILGCSRSANLKTECVRVVVAPKGMCLEKMLHEGGLCSRKILFHRFGTIL